MAPDTGVGVSNVKLLGDVASTTTDRDIVLLTFPAVSFAVTVRDLVPVVAPLKEQDAVYTDPVRDIDKVVEQPKADASTFT